MPVSRWNWSTMRLSDAAQLLQLAQLIGARLHVARQQLLDDLQAHLKTNEALQRTVMEIRGNALALGLPRALRLGSNDYVMAQGIGHTPLEITLMERVCDGHGARRDGHPQQSVLAAWG